VRAQALFRLEHYGPRSYARSVSTLRAEAQGFRHRAAARRLFPELARAVLFAALGELAPLHEAYVEDVSTPDYAISLPLAAFLLVLCRRRRPARLLDLGSGFSSFVLRMYQAGAPGRPEVWSVDDDDAWLERTAGYLRERGLGTDHLMGLDTFRRSATGSFDLVLHDLGAIDSPARAALLPTALELTAPSGVVVIDDLMDYRYRARVRAACDEAGLPLVNLRAHLMDDLRRYPGAAVAPRWAAA
jgi:predicted O-methyltransferase YrrM